jgi:hypothetical protein
LRVRFAIVRQSPRLWDEATLWDIMTAYIIMHNMILEDEWDLGRIESPYERGAAKTRHFVSRVTTSDFVSFIKKHEKIWDWKSPSTKERLNWTSMAATRAEEWQSIVYSYILVSICIHFWFKFTCILFQFKSEWILFQFINDYGILFQFNSVSETVKVSFLILMQRNASF